MGLNDSMALGAYSVVTANPAYNNILIAAAADGQKEALALIKEGGCTGRYISTGLNSPSLAAQDALRIAVDLVHRGVEAGGLPQGVLHQGGRHRLREHQRVLRPEQRFLIADRRL
jgi:ABC-type sugar transport system substrate-binding protein